MSLRKLIREELDKILKEENGLPSSEIRGFEILNHFPFNKLPNTKKEVNWSNKDVAGWGEVHLPSIEGPGLLGIYCKEDILGAEPWSNPKTGQVIQNPGYIENFKNKFGEEPVFVINPEAPWFSKIEVLNEPYLRDKGKLDSNIQSYGTDGD